MWLRSDGPRGIFVSYPMRDAIPELRGIFVFKRLGDRSICRIAFDLGRLHGGRFFGDAGARRDIVSGDL